MASANLSSSSAVWGYPVFLGIGLGWSLTYLTAVAQLSTPPHLIAITSGILLAIRSFGGAIGLAICTYLHHPKLRVALTNGDSQCHLQHKNQLYTGLIHSCSCSTVGLLTTISRSLHWRSCGSRSSCPCTNPRRHTANHRCRSTRSTDRVSCKFQERLDRCCGVRWCYCDR